INAITGKEDSELVAFPGALAGSINVATSSRLQGFEANALCNLCCCPCAYRVDAFAGFRYLDFDEGLDITEDLTVLPTVPVIGGSKFLVNDHVDAHNQFYGAQVGVRGEVWSGQFFARVTAKVALGDSEESVDINGFTRFTAPAGGVTTRP